MLTREQCFALLGSASVGRVALTAGSLPVILPVLYRFADDTVMFPVTGRLLETAARQGHIVCFETDGNGADPASAWSVIVTGRLNVIPAFTHHAVHGRPRDGRGWTASLPAELVSGRGSAQQGRTGSR